jgi:hypothetical protein
MNLRFPLLDALQAIAGKFLRGNFAGGDFLRRLAGAEQVETGETPVR